ncbi:MULTISPECIES: NAD(P)-binding domain-containing protein [unclassified Planococcus (in: firmicutes)]|uniref:NAD(P)-binding domain-containing protein n=1 Tax=unclassified Planococcus (in: firmicutes) TaxID=2662419 RepID=UPI001E385A33|nr:MULTISPECIES: NAD(P)-binding domain-containing protein [unclassified Planococcus (in: firmicutes)]
MKQQIGVIGLGVMGKNLALNMESKGYSVSVYDYWTDRIDELAEKEAQGKKILGAYSVEEFVLSLEPPPQNLVDGEIWRHDGFGH